MEHTRGWVDLRPAAKEARLKHSTTNFIYGCQRGGTDPNTNRLLHLAWPPVFGRVIFFQFIPALSDMSRVTYLILRLGLHCALGGCRGMATAELK